MAQAVSARPRTGNPPAPLILVNPTAGGGRGAAVWHRVRPILAGEFPNADIHLTTGPGDAEQRAAGWCAQDPGGILVVVGGDGSIHEAMNGMLGSRAASLAIIPAGTGNDMARNLRIPLDPLIAAAALTSRCVRLVDVGRCVFRDPDRGERSRWFLNSISLGTSARANRIAGRIGRVLGPARYPVAGVLALLSSGPAGYAVRSGDRALFTGSALNLTVANGPGFGGGLRISPDSRPDDAVCELVVIGAMSSRRGLAALARLRTGSHIALPEVRIVGGLRETIVILGDSATMAAEADGENFRIAGPLTIELHPGRLSLVGVSEPRP
jgi:diacylglycerol kinase (ATP)